MDEEWKIIPDFDDYGVSSLGRVENRRTNRILRVSRNSQGVVKVMVRRDGVSVTRSVARFVAEAFLPIPASPKFDTLIHLDANRSNLRADNLMWRTRAFAIKYHHQFNSSEFHNNRMRLRNVDTGEVLSLKETCMKHGLTYIAVVVAVHNQEVVHPTGQRFILG